jgi:hypothetical protein
MVLGCNSNTPRRELRVVITGKLWSRIAQSVRGINCWDVILVRGRNFLFVILPFSHSRRPIPAAFYLLWSQCNVRWNFNGNCLINCSILPQTLLSSLRIFLTFYSFILSPCFYIFLFYVFYFKHFTHLYIKIFHYGTTTKYKPYYGLSYFSFIYVRVLCE